MFQPENSFLFSERKWNAATFHVESTETFRTPLAAREGARDDTSLPYASKDFVVLPQFLRSPKKFVKPYVRDDGVNIGVVCQNHGQGGGEVMDTDSWVTVDLGRSTDRRLAKTSHHRAFHNDGGRGGIGWGRDLLNCSRHRGGCHWVACWYTSRIRADSRGSSGEKLF